ncbi:MAG: SNF2 helicase associated domain-containing protein [Labilithrix sp.]|nr:SNF2 helicase associated domain-containing protein [Labilithrix sp.]
MTSSVEARWVLGIDVARVEARFGADVVAESLAGARVYARPPALDAASRLVATVVVAPGGKRLSIPVDVSVRVRADDVLDVACRCGHPRVCEHVVGLLVDVAFHEPLRAALAAGAPTAALATELADVRARALEERTLDARLSAWLPPRAIDDAWELDVEVVVVSTAASVEPRAALLLRHRRPTQRALVAAKEVLAARLAARHRRLVELTAPYHLDKNVLVATRGQASILAHLLRDEIGVYAERFKARVRFGGEVVRLRVERDADRLVARWYAEGGGLVGDTGQTFLLAGPFPYLWAPAGRAFHPVAPEVDLDAALGMGRVPSLPLGGDNAARVGRALLVRGPGLGVTLPAPEVFGLPPLERPSFELRLSGTPLDVRAELFAVYPIGKLPVGVGVGVGASEGRDDAAESDALALLREAGFVATERGLLASEDDAVTLWQSGLARLRASSAPRFEVLVGESLATTKVGPPVELDVRVGAEVGWLDTELEFRAGSLGVELERMHRALAEGRRWVVLTDGSLARIADDVATLLDEARALGVTATGRGALRVPPHQLGRIARWIELADRPDARVSVRIDPRAAALRDRLRDVAKDPRPALPARLDATLRPYQAAGVAWLQLLRELGAGGVLADDMGLGKTLMTLAFVARWAEDEGRAPVLVVAPTSVVGNWVREAARFTPGLRAIAWTSAAARARGASLAASLEEHDLIVTTYGLLRREATRFARRRLRCVVLDEAQNVKNPASATARAARRLDADMRLALTGTPVENRLSELWSLMTFANPGMLGTAAEFDARYERPIGTRPDGAVAAELRATVRPFILRRTKSEVLVDLPPKTEIDRECVFGRRQKRAYDALALAVREAIRRDPKRRDRARTQLAVLTAILRLRQMACDPRLVDPSARPEDSAKRESFLDLVRELVSEDRRALVFSQFVELLTLWREDLDRAKVAYEYLDGSTTDRDAVVTRFQSGSAPLFLISLKAGGAGLNLTAADTVIHCDPWWNPAAEDQATDRAHRIGQRRAVTVVRLVARGTIEDKIALLKRQKHELAAAIVGADASALSGTLADDDIALLLGDVDGEIADDDRDGDAPAGEARG